MVLTEWMPTPDLAPNTVLQHPGYTSLGSTTSTSSCSGSRSGRTTEDSSGYASERDSLDREAAASQGCAVITLFAWNLESLLRSRRNIWSLSKQTGPPDPDLINCSLPKPRPVCLTDLGDIPLTAGMLILPPLATSPQGVSLYALLHSLGNRRLGVLDVPSAELAHKLCQPLGMSSTEKSFENVLLTPDMVGLAARFTENNTNNCLVNNSHATTGFASGSSSGNTNNDTNDEGSAVPSNDLLLESLCILQRWGKHVRVIGQPDELDVARYLSHMPRLKTISWEYPPDNGRTGDVRRVVSNGVISYGVRGLQGIALGHMLGPSVRLCLDGAPLGGMARRLSQFVSGNNGAGGGVDANNELQAAVSGLSSIRLTVGGSGSEPVTAADMDALKRLLLLASPQLESLIVRGALEEEHDGFAGASREGTEALDGGGFYLPAFSFLPGERLPPLRYLHLWRYDWRRHSSADVAAHWDFTQLRTLVFDGAPLRWFLGTLSFADLARVQTLRLDDAEWALQPGQGRQAALLVGYLVQRHVKALRRLELIRCYTDSLPLAALRRHAGTLEALVLRHPYGVGGGSRNCHNNGSGCAAGAELSDAPAANMTPLTLHALFEEGSNAEVGSDGMHIEMTVEMRQAMLLENRGTPAFSRLHTLEIDLDDRHVATGTSGLGTGNSGGPAEGIEAEMLSRLARLPRLTSLTLAVPSALRGLHCVPRYDVDLHQTLQRLVFLLGQREKRQTQQQKQMKQQPRQQGQGGNVSQQQLPQLPATASLSRIALHIGGWMPPRGTSIDEVGVPITHRLPPTMAPPLEPTMLTPANGAGAWAAPTFLAPSRDLDVSPGVGAALAMRAVGLRSQRCLVAERGLEKEGEDGPGDARGEGDAKERETSKSKGGTKGKEKRHDGGACNAGEGGSAGTSSTSITENTDCSIPTPTPARYVISEEFNDLLVEYAEDRPAELSRIPGRAHRVRVRQPYEIRFGRPQQLAEGPLWDANGLAMWP